MILAEKISLLRKKNGWSQEELAEQLGISRQSVSKWELGTSIPDLDKIIKMSAIFGVSTDYLLKDEMEEIAYIVDTEVCETDDARSVSLEEANCFMDMTEKSAGKIAASVSVLILSPVPLIFLGGLSEYSKGSISDNMAGGIGMIILLLLVAAGVSVLIITGMQLSPFDYLGTEMISLQYGIEGIVEKRKSELEPKYRVYIATGVAFCITGVVPLMAAAAIDAGDFVYVCCVDVLLMFISCGVYLFVRFGLVHESYEKLLQTGDYTREKKELGKKTSFFPGIYWCLVTAVYLAVSFYYSNWNTSWIIWPVAGVLFVALNGIVRAVAGTKK